MNMLYTIIDLSKNAIVEQCSSQESVVFFFLEKNCSGAMAPWNWNTKAAKIKPDELFRSLNMNGKDMATYKSRYMFFSSYIQKSDLFLRRHLVYNEEDRVLDPRTWRKAIETVLQSKDPHVFRELHPSKMNHRYMNWMPGRKFHSHRCTTPAFYYQMLKASQDEWGEEVEEFDVLYDRTSLRNRTYSHGDGWDRAEKKAFRTLSRSWKDQSHSRKQWGKHKPSCKRFTMPFAEDDFDQEYEDACYEAMAEYY